MKPNLLLLRRATTITTQDLARQAQLPVADVVAIEVGGYTSQEKASRVLSAFNLLTGMGIGMNDIRVHCDPNLHAVKPIAPDRPTLPEQPS